MTSRHPLCSTLAAALLPLLLGSCIGQRHKNPDSIPEPAIGYMDNEEQTDTCVPADYATFRQMSNYPKTLQVWKDDELLKSKGSRKVEIDLARQRGRFLVNGRVAMDFPVCTGSKRKPTPTGTFRITQKNIDHVSNIYHVPMPYFMRLTDYGIGLHVGDVFRTPSSHGCIRMTREACVPLYRNAPSGTRVHIRRSGWQNELAEAGMPQDDAPEGAEEAGQDSQASQLARAEG